MVPTTPINAEQRQQESAAPISGVEVHGDPKTRCDYSFNPNYPPKQSSRPSKALHIDIPGRSRTPQHRSDPKADAARYAQEPAVDLEKQDCARSPRSMSFTSTITGSTCRHEDGIDDEVVVEQKALWLLIYFSGPGTVLSLLVSVWTLFALAVSILLQPLRLCSNRNTFRQQLTAYLMPAFRLQLSTIYAHQQVEPKSVNPIPLLLICLSLSFVSIGVAVAAWLAACFWVYTAVIGDPAPTENKERSKDGKAFVLGIRKWWLGFLTSAIRR